MSDPGNTEREHEKLLQFLYQVPVGLASISPEGDIRLLNAAGARLLMPLGGGRIDNFWEIFDPYDDGLKALAGAPSMPGVPLCEGRRIEIRPDGSRLRQWLSMDLLRLDEGTLQACFVDVTKSVLAEQRAREALQEKAQQEGKIEIITNVLHDIGNAATGLGTRAARLLAEPDWPETVRAAQLVDFANTHKDALGAALGEAKAGALCSFLAALSSACSQRNQEARDNARFFTTTVGHIQDILNVQRGVVGHGSGAKQVPLHPAHLADDALAILRSAIEKRGIAVENRIAPDCGVVAGDRTRLLQVAINLLKNSIEAFDETPANPAKTIDITSESVADRDMLRIVMTDNGPGFDPALAESLFERGRTGKQTGSGFGLHHARSVVESHAGTLRLQSDGPGKGCRAILELPLHHP